MNEGESENDLEDNVRPMRGATGGLVFGGNFGEDAPSPAVTTLLYLRQINPNLIVIGGFFIGGIIGLNSLITGLGRANPNNVMLQTQQIQSQSYRETLTATTDLAKTVAKQQSGCVAVVCIYPGATSERPTEQPPQLQPPNYYQQVAATAHTVQINATMPEFWRYQWQHDPAYVNEWISACQAQGGVYRGWSSPECQALSQAMN